MRARHLHQRAGASALPATRDRPRRPLLLPEPRAARCDVERRVLPAEYRRALQLRAGYSAAPEALRRVRRR